MRATIIESVMGVLGFGEAKELIEKVLFPKDQRKVAEKLKEIENGKVIDEIAKLVKKLRERNFTVLMFENKKLARNVHEKFDVHVEVANPSEAGELLRENLGRFAREIGFVKEEVGLHEWAHKVSMELARIRVRRAVEKRDLMVIQAIQTINDLDKTLNLFSGRAREWYSLHFPELDKNIEKHETFARLVANLGKRENFTREKIGKGGLPEAKGERIYNFTKTSMGADLRDNDIDQIRAMCKIIIDLFKARQMLEDYLDTTMNEVAPNTRTLVGSLLGARLIALAGGLNNIARMPSSTIQVLGAEKALFRALRTGTKSPKHGIIFQHTLIHEAKTWQRGKIARALAGKLAIAARTDAFGDRHLGEELKTRLEKRVREIKEKHTDPPLQKKTFKRGTRRMRRGRRG